MQLLVMLVKKEKNEYDFRDNNKLLAAVACIATKQTQTAALLSFWMSVFDSRIGETVEFLCKKRKSKKKKKQQGKFNFLSKIYSYSL